MPMKTCDGCGNKCGPRTKTCPNCLTEFQIVPKILRADKKPGKKVVWQDLEPGDIIQVSKRKGPHFLTCDGRKIGLNHKGKYIVYKVVEEGIHAFHFQGHYHSFIYMGPTREDKVNNTIFEAHKIRKLDGKYTPKTAPKRKKRGR